MAGCACALRGREFAAGATALPRGSAGAPPPVLRRLSKADKFKGELIDVQAWPTRDLARRAIVVRGCTAPTDTAALPNRGIEQDQEGSVTKRSALSVRQGNRRRRKGVQRCEPMSVRR